MSEATKSFHHRIENRLWTILISWMETNPRAHDIILELSDFKHKIAQRGFWVRILFWISLGFCLGLAIGMTVAFLN